MALTKVKGAVWNSDENGFAVSLADFGVIGDGGTDDTAEVGEWLDYLITNQVEGYVPKGTYLIETSISKIIPNGLRIRGEGVFKAGGASRLNMLLFTGCTGDVHIDGITVDGNNLVARPFEIKNTGSSTDGNVYLGQASRFINAKNIAPATNAASACRIQGNFENVVFAGEVDGVDNSLTSGAVSVGFWADWTTTYFIKNVVVTGTARVKNVKNDNATTADADGIQRMGPTTEHLFFTIQPGAYFENCKGRSIKSQVIGNAIDGPIIKRDAYDGLTEIDLQYAGGYAKGVRLYYDGVRVNNCLGSSTRLNLASDSTFAHNTLNIVNGPVTETGSMCFFWGTDNTDAIVQEGLLAYGNKVIGGSVDYMVTVYCANVIDTNRLIVRDNWAESIAEAYVNFQVVFNNPAQLTIVFEGNGCGSQCTGINIVSSGRLTVESDRNNSKISPLPPREVTIAAGVLTVYAGTYLRVATEGGAGFDDVDTISGGNYSHGETVVFKMAASGQVPTFKDGTGNIHLAGSDFALNHVRDTLVLSYDKVNDEWVEISRADNG
jgi:hypothetical protein